MDVMLTSMDTLKGLCIQQCDQTPEANNCTLYGITHIYVSMFFFINKIQLELEFLKFYYFCNLGTYVKKNE